MSQLIRILTFGILIIQTVCSVAFAQQSTTGPTPPVGIDNGLRKVSSGAVVLDGVPAYIWHHGCGPTALGMVIGYWDSQGYPDLVPGNASAQTAFVNAMIANDGQNASCGGAGNHYSDYACPIDGSPNPVQPDRSSTGGAHPSNCVADFMRTSWSSAGNYYGWSWVSDMAPAFNNYVNYAAPAYGHTATTRGYVLYKFSDYKASIDAGSPVVLLVDSDGDGATDHFVTGIGYDDATGSYACRNTWDQGMHWYQWHQMTSGNAWGIFAATEFCIGPLRAAFEVSPDSACGPSTVAFTSRCDGAPTTIHWTFGDGVTSIQRNPIHRYESEGIYVVTLSASSSCGSDLAIDTVKVTYCSCCINTTGNVNGDPDDIVDIADLSALLDYLFNSGTISSCVEECDIDRSGEIDIADLQNLVDFLFFGTTLPACL
jgi:PKD repeat protein